jgi:hypothetical protein
VRRTHASALAAAVLLAGCGQITDARPSGEPVPLQTTAGDCGSNWVEGLLVANGDHGTDIAVQSIQASSSDDPAPLPPGESNVTSVAWPGGFTAVRWAGGEVAVMDAGGRVVAETGRSYRLRGSLVVAGPIGAALPPGISPLQGLLVCGDQESVIAA